MPECSVQQRSRFTPKKLERFSKKQNSSEQQPVNSLKRCENECQSGRTRHQRRRGFLVSRNQTQSTIKIIVLEIIYMNKIIGLAKVNDWRGYRNELPQLLIRPLHPLHSFSTRWRSVSYSNGNFRFVIEPFSHFYFLIKYV